MSYVNICSCAGACVIVLVFLLFIYSHVFDFMASANGRWIIKLQLKLGK